MNPETLAYKPGLEGVVAAETRRSYVNGQTGTLLIAGYPLADIAAQATFEEVVYVLWRGLMRGQRAQLGQPDDCGQQQEGAVHDQRQAQVDLGQHPADRRAGDGPHDPAALVDAHGPPAFVLRRQAQQQDHRGDGEGGAWTSTCATSKPC